MNVYKMKLISWP